MSLKEQLRKYSVPKTTSYKGLTSIYFYKILNTIINIGKLSTTKKLILDFGCGLGTLKQKLPGINVVGYDIVADYSEVSDWQTINFDIFVANQVFYVFEPEELEKLLEQIRILNPKALLIIGTSRKGRASSIRLRCIFSIRGMLIMDTNYILSKNIIY